MYAELYDMPVHGSGDFTRDYVPAIGAMAIRSEVFFLQQNARTSALKLIGETFLFVSVIGGAIIIVCVLRNLFLPVLYSVRGWF